MLIGSTKCNACSHSDSGKMVVLTTLFESGKDALSSDAGNLVVCTDRKQEPACCVSPVLSSYNHPGHLHITLSPQPIRTQEGASQPIGGQHWFVILTTLVTSLQPSSPPHSRWLVLAPVIRGPTLRSELRDVKM